MTTPNNRPPPPPKNIRPLNRYITTHSLTTQKAIFSTTLPEEMPLQQINDSADAQFSLAYTTDSFPVDLAAERDIPAYSHYLSNPPGITISTGTVCRIVDMPPHALSPMHRTVSLDYGVVLEGEVELVLDSGETRLLKRGDVAVQRGTNHAWRNVTPDTVGADGEAVQNWARMLYVLSPAVGLGLGEDLGGIEVRDST
ncbi:cupin domain-containing protein [Aspergillus homomorphus CBS 101889]|uniref:Cupin domain protein n=1 Tax=Aspergillus homomorphus (strain CBS 101889) TaxID=1450537 RepID=A0A395HH47_ASPHC|nr:cupin domain protein [Aspergillus homomorphus CBS 101889]RAL07221.1 cupin domain protein [Aspergillus homomorphus CBS 101889]